MRYIVAEKIPTEVKMLSVTKKELEDMRNKFRCISVSLQDEKWLASEEDDAHVGYLAGEIGRMHQDQYADVWFVNKNYFNKNYRIVKEEEK